MAEVPKSKKRVCANFCMPEPCRKRLKKPQVENEAQEYLEYNPDLSFEENPIYYDANKLLYQLHLDRINRKFFKDINDNNI